MKEIIHDVLERDADWLAAYMSRCGVYRKEEAMAIAAGTWPHYAEETRSEIARRAVTFIQQRAR